MHDLLDAMCARQEARLGTADGTALSTDQEMRLQAARERQGCYPQPGASDRCGAGGSGLGAHARCYSTRLRVPCGVAPSLLQLHDPRSLFIQVRWP